MTGAGERDALFSNPTPPTSGPGSKKRRRWFLGVCGLLVALILFAFSDVLLPFLLGLVVAYVLSPLVALGQQVRIRGRNPPRWTVVLALYLTLIGLLATLVAFSGPRLAAELGRLSKEAPRAVAEIRHTWLPELNRRVREAAAPYLPPQPAPEEPVLNADPVTGEVPPPPEVGALEIRPRPDGSYQVILPAGGLRVVPDGERAFRVEAGGPRTKRHMDIASAITAAAARAMETPEQTGVTVLQTAQRIIAKLARGVLGFLVTLVVSAYLLITTERIFEFARSLYPAGRRNDFDDLMRSIDRGLSGVVRGQLIICGINAVLSGIGFYMFGLKYWTFLTILAGVMSIVPIFGSILSSIPAVAVALTQDVGLAVLVLAWIVGIHQLEAHVLNPKILGDAARVHPVLVVFALLAGEHAAGLVGALLAVPVLSIVQTLFLFLRERFLGVPRMSMPPNQPGAPAAPPLDPT